MEGFLTSEDEYHIETVISDPVYYNNKFSADVIVKVFDSKGQPRSGLQPQFKTSGMNSLSLLGQMKSSLGVFENVSSQAVQVGACSLTDDQGLSRCTLTSVEVGEVGLVIDFPQVKKSLQFSIVFPTFPMIEEVDSEEINYDGGSKIVVRGTSFRPGSFGLVVASSTTVSAIEDYLKHRDAQNPVGTSSIMEVPLTELVSGSEMKIQMPDQLTLNALYKIVVVSKNRQVALFTAKDIVAKDLRGPVLEFTQKPLALDRSKNFQFKFSATDNASQPAGITFKCSLNGASWATCVSPKAESDIVQGQNEYRIEATDQVGNKTVVAYTWFHDSIPPLGNITFSGIGVSPTSNTSNRTIAVSLPATATHYKITQTTDIDCSQVDLESLTERAASSTYTMPVSSNSLNSLCAIARDEAGNWQSVATRSSEIRVDTSAPKAPDSLTHQASYGSLVQTPVFTWTAALDNDGGSGVVSYELAIGSTPGGTEVLNWVNVGLMTSTMRVINLASYENKMLYPSVRAVDGVGFRGMARSSGGWYVGTPTIGLTLAQPTASDFISLENRSNMVVSGECSENGKNVTITVTGAGSSDVVCAMGSYSKSYDLTSVNDGNVTFTVVHASDLTSRTLSVVVPKDTLVPTVSFTSPMSGTSYAGNSSSSFTITGSCSEVGRSVDLSTNYGFSAVATCQSNQTWSKVFDFSDRTESVVVVEARITDTAGNFSAPAALTLKNGSQIKLSPDLATETYVGSVTSLLPIGNTGKMAFLAPGKDDGRSDVLVANADFTGLKNLTPAKDGWSVSGQTGFLSGKDVSADFIYSSAHNKIFFRTCRVGRGTCVIDAVRPDGTGRSTIINTSTANRSGSVTQMILSEDQQTIVFRADFDIDELFEIYAANVDGSNVRKLNGPLVAGGIINSFMVTKGSVPRVLIAGRINDVSQEDLYSVKFDGTDWRRISPTVLNASGATARGVLNYRLTPDHSKVVYTGDFTFNDVYELYAVPSDGSVSPLRLTPEVIDSTRLIFGGDRFVISPDSLKVAISSDFGETDNTYHLQVVNLDGSGWKRLSPNPANVSADVFSYAWSPDSTKIAVAYDEKAGEDDRYRLYIVNADKAFDDVAGNGWTELAGASQGNLNATINPHAYRTNEMSQRYLDFTPDGTKVVYSQDTDTDNATHSYDLYAVDIQSLVKVKLSLDSALINRGIRHFEISPNSQKILFFADLEADEQVEMYLANLDGTGRVKLSQPLLTLDGDVHISRHNYFVDWIAGRVTYIANRRISSYREAYVADFQGGEQIRLENRVTVSDLSSDVVVVPATDKVLYRFEEGAEKINLYMSTADGASRMVLNHTLGVDGFVSGFWLAPNGQYVVYRSRDTVTSPDKLYRVTISPNLEAPVQVSGVSQPGSTITDVKISPDSAYVVYRADQEVDNNFRLYSVKPDGTAIYALQPADMPSGRQVFNLFEISPNSSLVAFVAEYNTLGKQDLYVVSLTGTGFKRVNSSVTSSSAYDIGHRPIFSNDSSKLIFVGDQSYDNDNEIYSVNVDGTGQIRLSPTLATHLHDTYSFLLTEEGDRVIVRGDFTYDEVMSLYSVKIDGTEWTDLTTTMPNNSYGVREAARNEVTPLGSLGRVLFRADMSSKGEFDVFSVKYDGTGLVKLGPAGATGTVYTVSPDQQHVFILSVINNQIVPVVSKTFENTALQLMTLSSFADLHTAEFEFLTNSKVVFKVDHRRDQQYDLYTININGTDLRRVSPNFPVGFTGVGPFSARASGDGQRIIFGGDLNSYVSWELFSVPLDP